MVYDVKWMQHKGMKRSEFPLLILVLALLGTAIFTPTLAFPMVFDDEIYLVGNPIFKNFENFSGIFHNFQGVAKLAAKHGIEGDISTNFVMRPLTYLSFYWNHRIGGLNPWGYRLINVLIHCTNALLVWRLASVLLQEKGLRHVAVPKASPLIPVLSSLLFFIHPLQIESVVYIIQRATSLCTLFYLAAILCHFQANTRASVGWRIGSVLSVLGAMFSKESGVTAPVLAVLLDIAVFGTTVRLALWRARWLLVLLPIPPVLLTAVSYAQTGVVRGYTVLNIASGAANSSYAMHYTLTQPFVWLSYLRLLICPNALNIDPDVPLVRSATDLRFWGAALGLLSIFALPLLLRAGRATRFLGNAAGLGLCWFALTISPDSSLVPLPDCMAEHRSYLPSVGIFILAAALVCSLPLPHFGVGAVGLLLAGTLSVATVQRCKVWSTPESLWRDVCDKSPGKPRPWINLGAAYFEAGKLEESEAAFLQSLQVTPTVPAFSNLAVINLKRNLPERAITFAQQGMQYRPSGYDQTLLVHLGDACAQIRRWQDAIGAYREALALNPHRLEVRLRLCGCLLETFNFAAALDVLREGLLLQPESAQLADAIVRTEKFQDQFKLRLGP